MRFFLKLISIYFSFKTMKYVKITLPSNHKLILRELVKFFKMHENKKGLYYFDFIVTRKDDTHLKYVAMPIWDKYLFSQIDIAKISCIIKIGINKEVDLNRIPNAISSLDIYEYENQINNLNIKNLQSARNNGQVTIVIPTKLSKRHQKEETYLEFLLESIYKTKWFQQISEIIICLKKEDNEIFNKTILDKFSKQFQNKIKTINVEGSFNFSKTINLGVIRSKNQNVLILNDDMVIEYDFNINLGLNLLTNPDVGVIGFLTLFDDDRVQQFGVSEFKGIVHETWKGTKLSELNHLNLLTHEVYAVSAAAILINRDKYLIIGGLDENFPLEYNDVDLSIRFRQNSLKVLVTYAGKLYHFESKTRGASHSESDFLKLENRYGNFRERDEYLFTP